MPTGTAPGQADVLHSRTRRDDRRVLQNRQHRRHVPQSRLDRVDHLADVLGPPQRGIDLRLNAPVADAGQVTWRLDECVGLRRRLLVVGVAVVVPVGPGFGVLEADDDVEVVGAPAVVVDTAVASKARQPYREANAVARSPPASCQPTMASTRFCATASPYSATGSSARTDASMPTLRNWSAAVLATATDVGSLAATPITNDSGTPSLVMRPRSSSGKGVPGVGGGGVSTADS